MDYGLVLCGGGGRGAYQIGVFYSLAKYGYIPKIKAVSGTSVGALNAALFTSYFLNNDLNDDRKEQAKQIWCSLKKSDLMDWREYMSVPVKSFASKSVKHLFRSSFLHHSIGLINPIVGTTFFWLI